MTITATTESRIRELLDLQGFDGDCAISDTLDSLELDSLDRTEFAMAIEEEFGIEVKSDAECE